MKKLSLILLSFIFVMVSCGSDDSEGQNEVTRPQDGNGKVFLENGTLVDATLDFTSDQLKDALSKYEWEREYSFNYDNTKVTGRIAASGMPLKITNGMMSFAWQGSGADNLTYKDIAIKGKYIIATQHHDITSSVYLPASTYLVVALDLTDQNGRIVMDYVPGESEKTSMRLRMVWHAVFQK